MKIFLEVHFLNKTFIKQNYFFDNSGYDMKSGEYSTWTESIWQSFGMRMLLKPSKSIQRLNLMLGSGVAGLSIVIVWFITSRADKIFNQG